MWPSSIRGVVVTIAVVGRCGRCGVDLISAVGLNSDPTYKFWLRAIYSSPQHARLPQPRPPRVVHFNFKPFAWIIPSSFWCLQIVDSFAKTLDGVASGVERFLLELTVYQDQWSKRARIRHSFILFTEFFSLYSNSRSFSSLGSHIFPPWSVSTTA